MVSEAKRNNWGSSSGRRQSPPTRCKGLPESPAAKAKRSAIETATRYYERELPDRLGREKQTLAKLTGWSLAEIDRMSADSGNVVPGPGEGRRRATGIAGRQPYLVAKTVQRRTPSPASLRVMR